MRCRGRVTGFTRIDRVCSIKGYDATVTGGSKIGF